jgi:hypothetical protein
VQSLGETLRQGKPRIRAYSAWALGRIGGAGARRHLEAAFPVETSRAVKSEIKQALEE